MNNWWQWIVPLIVAVFWIVGMLAKGQREQIGRQQNRTLPQMPPNEENPPMAQGKRQPEEIRKFLEELRRQRSASARDGKAEMTSDEEPTAQVVRPKPAPRQPPPVPVVVRKPPKRPPIGQDPVQVVPLALPSLVSAAPTQVATRIVKPTPVAVRQTLDLLKNRQSLASAFLLREILDLPVSRRPRRLLTTSRPVAQ